jgi:His/Glu/Gln/Arg/opine family amino acid ABC transporter permease subunit
MSFNLERILSYIPELLKGTLLTVELTLLSITFASIIGLIVALMRISKLSIISIIASIYVEFVRNIPDLVLIFYIFYVLPVIGIRLGPIVAGCLALSLHFGAYISEVFRAGILSIANGQWEAATVLGMSKPLMLRRIILPQALRRAVPSWANYFIGMFKSTALVSAVAVQELLYTAKTIGAYNFRYYELFTIVAIIYFLICYPTSLLVRRLEQKVEVVA